MDPKNEACLAAIMVRNVCLPDGWWNGRGFPMILRKSWADHWKLAVPEYSALIAAENAAFFGDFRRPSTGVKMGPGNEACLAAISVHNVGLPDGWWNVRDFPRVFRKSWTNRWKLTVPD